MKMPSVMRGQAKFAQVPRAAIPRSQFDRSHGVKTTFDAGLLVPIYLDEALPGDTFQLSMSGFARLTTPIKPLMDNIYLDTFFFAVPYRLLWANWEKFNGAQDDPGDSTSFTIPQMTVPSAGYVTGRLEDYLGLPVDVASSTTSWTHSCLPRRAYYKIYNEWFRDENLIDSFSVSTGDGPDTTSAGGSVLRKRNKRHDYFTSCLPWLQKGDSVELTDTFAVVPETGGNQIPKFKGAAAGNAPLQAKTASATPDIRASAGTGAFTVNESLIWDDPQLEVEPTFTINEMRQAFATQKLLERDARGGTRYTEIVKSHFGVTSPDARLQRSEYLGGGTTPVIINPVAQTAETNASVTPQGNLAGVGTAAYTNHGFVKSFTEHCILLGIASVRADLTYFQGKERHWDRSTRYDFYWPALATIGEQAVYNKELYLQDTTADESVFGYQERYAEYRYKPSRITGLMRPGVSGTLRVWHLAQEFGSLPTLNQTFIEEDIPFDEVLAVTTEPEFLFDGWINLKCARPMPLFGVPGLIDHF